MALLNDIINPQVIQLPVASPDGAKLIICTGTAVFFLTTGGSNILRDTISFNVRQNDGTDLSLSAAGVITDDVSQITALAALASLDNADAYFGLWAVDAANAFQRRSNIVLTANLAIAGERNSTHLYRFAYQVTMVTRPHVCNPLVFITGDTHIEVSNLDLQTDPTVAGNYQAHTHDIPTPISFNWCIPGTTGMPSSCNGSATDIAFDMTGARVGQTRRFHVQVVATGSNGVAHCDGVAHFSTVFPVSIHVFRFEKNE